jgi:hypothetical protein
MPVEHEARRSSARSGFSSGSKFSGAAMMPGQRRGLVDVQLGAGTSK